MKIGEDELRRVLECLQFLSCDGLDDADFHAMDPFERTEGLIKLVHTARAARDDLKESLDAHGSDPGEGGDGGFAQD